MARSQIYFWAKKEFSEAKKLCGSYLNPTIFQKMFQKYTFLINKFFLASQTSNGAMARIIGLILKT